MTPAFRGIHAALVTPVTEEGAVDHEQFRALIDFVMEAGVDGLCIGGGTSEYPHFDVAERKEIISAAADHLQGRGTLIAAIGAGRTAQVLELGRHAVDAGSDALLLPMPHFYNYMQQDLLAFSRTVARTLGAPCLLYNLSAFTNELDVGTTLQLLRDEEHIVGLKDSSGNREALSALSGARNGDDFTLLCGADELALTALRTGWDGAISGIASFCPEALVAVYRHTQAGRRSEADRAQERLDELVEAVLKLPFPWSIRIGAGVRGVPTGPLPLPASERRRAQIDAIKTWYAAWFDRHLPALASAER